jgi:endonuclease YncB( thermonuclease family)
MNKGGRVQLKPGINLRAVMIGVGYGAVLWLVIIAGSVMLARCTHGAELVQVIDGDTFRFDDGTTIRLAGIDAPEGSQKCALDGVPWRCGQAAALALEEMLAGQNVTCITEDVDHYGREVARCAISQGRLDVGSLMVGDGWAFDYVQYSRGRYAQEQAIAQERRSGIWIGGPAGVQPPWEWRRLHR